MGDDDLLGDPQSKAMAFSLGSKERIKDGSEFLLRDSGTSVQNRDGQGVADNFGGYFDLTVTLDSLNGIDYQVHQGLGEPDVVGLDLWKVVIYLS